MHIHLRTIVVLGGALLWAAVDVRGAEKSAPTDASRSVVVTLEKAQFFERTVRPILVNNCLKCHGPNKQESGLRLDSRAALFKGGENGPAAVAGSETSMLIRAVRRQDGLEMPPDRALPSHEVEALLRWVKMGLPWPEDPAGAADRITEVGKSHWAFQPIHDPNVPDVIDREWPRDWIDRFILARLEGAKLKPSPSADRRTLIRRATYDLLGLPPAPEDVKAFEADTSPDAFAQVVDRLLASPHYGERWGRYWLDVARYADSKGYVFFEEPTFPWAYTYRDYVIEAFNQDLPYDRFVLEQLAGDRLVSQDDQRPLRALGFLTLGGHFMNNVHDIIDDRIDVVTRGLMGLSVTCARCHDHKFDPVPQEDYYALYGVFSSSQEPTVPPMFTTPPDTEEYRKFAAELEAREKKLNDFTSATVINIVQTARSHAAEYLLAAHALRNQPSTEDFMLLADKGDLNPTVITRWRKYLENAARRQDPVWTIWHSFANLKDDEFSDKAPEITAAYSLSGGALISTANPLVRNAFNNAVPLSMAEVARRYADLLLSIDSRWNASLQQARQQKTLPPDKFTEEAEEALRQVFYGPDGPPNIPPVIGWGFLTLLPDRPSQEEYKKLLKDVENWSMKGPGAPPRAMVLVDAPNRDLPRVFLRGNPNRPGKEVARGFPAVAGRRAPFHDGSGRLELARAIVSRDNPLTARVLANRIWQGHFGTGLVSTPSDFGIRGEPPSHPDLLDRLATELMNNRWSIKSLHRQILLSAAWQQSSAERDDGRTVDPENRLLWRMNRRRLDFESARDTLVAASGSLAERMHGPPVDLLGKEFVSRRTIYGFVDRLNVPGLLTAFDFPSPDASNSRRENTTVPPQALYLMNGPFVLECGKRFSQRSDVKNLASTEARLTRTYELLFSRVPSERETELAREYLGAAPSTAAWTYYAQALLMTNELLFVD